MTESDSSPAAIPSRSLLPEAAGLRAVFFDFDGVILESAAIKDNAFLELFSHLPEHVGRILEHHRDNLGHSRFEKFEWIYREILGRELDEEESRALGERFSALVESKVSSCPMVPGALSLLDALHGRLECFVASATPQRELENIIESRALGKYFRGICGAPPAKTEIFARLLDRHRLEPHQVLAIGDGISDYRAAERTGVHFVARACVSSHQDWSSIPVVAVSDLSELLEPLGVSRID
ncbi:MAG: HAD family hydrolase [bacterium]|nr:HAD family hydrolase [bacterium]